MRILSLKAEHFRNLESIDFTPHPSLNLILGNNAQGKTSLLEAIWCCTGCKSFRGAKERDLIGFKAPAMHLHLCFEDERRRQEIQIHMQRGEGRQKKLLLNNVPLKGGSGLFSQFRCVVFSPDDREMIRGLPEKRRNFMDLCSSQLSPGMLPCLNRFEHLMLQRNAVLKQIQAGLAPVSALEEWDLQLAAYGSMLTCLRHAYMTELAKVCEKFYGTITAEQENLTVRYRSNVFRNSEIPEKPTKEMQQVYFEQLKSSVEEDIRLGFTTKGAGRDDFLCKINGFSVRDYGSQGQQKSTALVLKLAQAAVFHEKKGETPIILLDDVMGELDEKRQDLVYEIIRDMQVFLTACHEEAVGREIFMRKDGECGIFRMENGRLSR